MTWERVKGDKTEYLRRAPWIICKCFVDGATLYVLSNDDGVRFGNFESSDDAKAHADSIELANTP